MAGARQRRRRASKRRRRSRTSTSRTACSAACQAAARIDGRLYLGTAVGRRVPGPELAGRHDGPAHFEHVDGTGPQCWCVREDDRPGAVATARPCSLACGDGALRRRGSTTAIPIKKTRGPQLPPECPRSSRSSTRRGSGSACSTASPRSGGSTAAGSTKAASRAPTYEIRSLFEDPDGSVWAGTGSDGIVPHPLGRPGPAAARRGPRPTSSASARTTGLPVGRSVRHRRQGHAAIFRAASRTRRRLRFDATTRRFVRDTAFDHVVGVNLIRQRRVLRQRPAGPRLPESRAGDGGAAAAARRDLGRRQEDVRAVRQHAGRAGSLLDGDVAWMQFSDGRLVRYDTSQRDGGAPSAGRS